MLRPEDPEGMRRALDALEEAWSTTIATARALPEAKLHESVGGEWSFVQTLRHLVMAVDKWFTAPILGEPFDPIGLPNTGSIDFDFPGLDLASDPTFAEVLAVRANRAGRFREYLDSLDASDLDREVVVLENGRNSVRECVYTVFEEEFWHNRYAQRDLAQLS
jgi:DinB superfamily